MCSENLETAEPKQKGPQDGGLIWPMSWLQHESPGTFLQCYKGKDLTNAVVMLAR